MLASAAAALAVAAGWSGTSRADAPAGRYVVDAAKGTVLDKVTKLTWQRAHFNGTKNWNDAKSYCDALDFAGSQDWRLPSRKELVTLVDHTRKSPAIDTNAFPGTPAEWFWTATSYAPSSGNAWSVNFSNGTAGSLDVTDAFRVRCVR